MAVPKKAPAQKFPALTYPEDAFVNEQHNPDRFPLWSEPKDWKTSRTEIVSLTPEVAKKMLERGNPLNAIRTKQNWVTELRSRMNRGKWSLMDTIEFDWNGVLGNGHHRLEACAGGEAIILVQVSYGRNPNNFHKYDDNFKRGNDTVLGIAHQLTGSKAKADAAVLSGALTWTHRYWDDDVQSLESRTAIYKEDRLEADAKYPELEELLANIRNIAKHNKSKLPTQESILLALFALGNEVNRTKTREFIRNVITGAQLDTNDPAHVYREFLRDSAAKGKGQRVYTSLKVEKGLLALKYHLDGIRITRLVSRKGIPRLSAEHTEFFDALEAEKIAKRKAVEAAKAKVAQQAAAAAAS
jgi:hypothetical protein